MMQYAVYAVLGVCCAGCMLYLVYAILRVCCTPCMLYSVYAVLSVCCTRYQCKGTYASVRPYRHTYGNYGIRLQTWTRVIVNRCIGKIIARDLSLVAS